MKTINYNIAKVMKSMIACLIILGSIPTIANASNNSLMIGESRHKEIVLNVEEWMNSQNYWTEGTIEEGDTESTLIIEEWMTQSTYWGDISQSEEKETLTTLKIESWMNSSDYWLGRHEEEQDAKMEIESWMNNSAYWNGIHNTEEQDLTLNIESWMNNNSFWMGTTEEIVEEEKLATF